jgi:LPXTG-motif cell wall-anchored protein
MKSRWLSLAIVCGLLALAPVAKANEWDKRTIVTFNEPVEIPGKVLPAGTYVMRLADSPSNRNIVQIFNSDETKLVDTVMAIPDYREEPTGKTVITFEERAGNSPQAMKSWFYPGDLYGVEFVYPNESPKTEVAKSTPSHHPPQYTAQPAATPAPAHTTATAAVTPKPTTQVAAKPAPHQSTQMAMAKPEPSPGPAPAPAPQAQTKPAPKPAAKTLPKTASGLPFIALIGAFAIAAGLVLRKRVA